MRSVLTFAVAVTVLLGRPAPANAWWEEGHRVVARIAAAHLSPAAQARIAEMLEVANTPEAVANALAAASTWADEVKVDTGTSAWHFINLAWQDNRANFAAECPNDDCVTARIRLFTAQLKANDPDADSRFNDEDALRFLVHFVGDVHQPLHASNDADQGGNCDLLEESVGDAKNVHALWDGPLVSEIESDDTALAAALNSELSNLTDGHLAELASGDAQDWAWEAHRIALSQVYRKLDIPKEDAALPPTCADAPDEIQQLQVHLQDDYTQAMQPVVREQLKKAGLRLARLLNEVFPAGTE